VNSAFVAAAFQEFEFSEVDVAYTAMTGQKKPDAEPKDKIQKSLRKHDTRVFQYKTDKIFKHVID